MSEYTASVYYNDEKDEHGRHVAWCDGYEHGHQMHFVTTFTVEAEDVHHAAEVVWRQMNRVDGNEYISTANIEDRSMCVGDVVCIVNEHGTSWVAADSIGFKDISAIDIEKASIPITRTVYKADA